MKTRNELPGTNNLLLSCDWGTSSFRLRLIDADTHRVLDEVLSDEGISFTHRAWENHEEPAMTGRSSFYMRRLLHQIHKLSHHAGADMRGIPLIISGMASSSLGLLDLPYAPLPFDIDGSGLVIEVIDGTDEFPHDLYLISGVTDRQDVMRGEETQLIGVFELLGTGAQEWRAESTLIFPGTHSKHIYVKEGKITGFSTYVTGELFGLMSRKSILQESITVPGSDTIPGPAEQEAFRKGVRLAQSAGLIRTLFTVRTNLLFGLLGRQENYYFLSGLVIGAELRELTTLPLNNLVLCSGHHTYDLYREGMEELGLSVHLVPATIMERAAVEGQIRIFQEIIHQTQPRRI